MQSASRVHPQLPKWCRIRRQSNDIRPWIALSLNLLNGLLVIRRQSSARPCHECQAWVWNKCGWDSIYCHAESYMLALRYQTQSWRRDCRRLCDYWARQGYWSLHFWTSILMPSLMAWLPVWGNSYRSTKLRLAWLSHKQLDHQLVRRRHRIWRHLHVL